MPRSDALTSLKCFAEERRFFRPDLPVTYRTARGCLDVLGALNAEAGGTMAQMPLPVHAAVAVQVDDQPRLRIRSAQIAPPVGEPEVTVPTAGAPAPHAAWAAELVALWSQAGPAAARGASILIHSDIPQGAGQSSSTALLTAVAWTLAEPPHAVSPLVIAQRVAAAEATAAQGSAARIPTGAIIEALTCMHSRSAKSQVLRYSAQPHRFVGSVPLPSDVRILALDTGVRYAAGHAGWSLGHGLGAGDMGELLAAAAMGRRLIETIYGDLGQAHTPLQGYLANTSPLLYRQYFRALLPRRMRAGDFVRTYGSLPELPARTDENLARVYRVRTAVDHLISEHEHAEQFLQALEELADVAPAGPAVMEESERQRILQRAGRLLLASHHSYRLRLELSCREADWLVDRLMEAGPERGVYGARITGKGGGGTVAALLARAPAATEALLEVMKAYNQVTGLVLGVTEA
jgi:galactokinase